MTTDEPSKLSTPLVADSAPTVNLVARRDGEQDLRIRCRHVVTLLGSREGCKVQLRHEHVAPVHVAIVNNGKQVTAVDLLTNHPAKLNSLKMEHEHLTDGDRLTVGPWVFSVEVGNPSQGGDADTHPFDLEPTPKLVALEHIESGRVLQPNRDVCIIGRRRGCDIVISESDVSRAHALLVNYFEYPAIVDLLTSNGTLVNGEAVHFAVLKDKDVLTIGESQFRVRLIGSSVGAKPGTNGKAASPGPIELVAEAAGSDLIDIHKTESSQRWRVAESVEKLQKVARKE